MNFLLLSLGTNALFLLTIVFLVLKLRRVKGLRQIEEYAALQRDLKTFGGGIVELHRVHPEDVFVRSPR